MTLKNISTPDFGGATDVTVVEILVKPGDHIQTDSTIMVLESDKATMDLPAAESGVVKELKVKVGDKVNTGDLLLTIETAAAEQKKPERTEKKIEEPKEEVRKEAPKKEPPKEILTGTLQTTDDAHAGPGVRRFARELGVNLAQVAGTGPKQRIIKEDVQSYVKNQLTGGGVPALSFASMPTIDFSKFGATTVEPLSRLKKLSGKNLQRNWMMIPHVTQFAEADITTLEEFRISQKKELEKESVKLTPLVFIMKAVVASLKAFPFFNASLDTTGENLILKQYFHLGIAVDTPEGLIVPVIKDVDKKGLIELAKELADVSERARKKQLMPADLQGGCFSISSLGGIGGSAFTPIINAPEVAILGISKSSYQPVWEEGQFVPRLMLPISLSYDHRVIDGAQGARFIVHLTNMLSDIRNLLM